MLTWLAVAVHRCEVAGVPSGNLDVRVRQFRRKRREDVDTAIAEEPTHSYQNGDGEEVTWPLAGVLAIEEVGRPADGDEVVGFIAQVNEFQDWARLSAEEPATATILSSAINAPVVQLPGRRFPAIALQGDTLFGLHQLAERIAKAAASPDLGGSGELAGDAVELAEKIGAYVAIYEATLGERGLPLPYSAPRRQ